MDIPLHNNFWRTALLSVFLFIYYSITYHQIVGSRLDGDIPDILVNVYHTPIYDDPLGLEAIWHQRKIANVNRYIVCIAEKVFFTTVGRFIHGIDNPTEKVHVLYSSIAICKILIQAMITLLMSLLLRRVLGSSVWIWWMVFNLLISHDIFYEQIGIIDHSINYTFFYAFAAGLQLVFYFVLHTWLFIPRKGILMTILLYALVIVTVFSNTFVLAIHGLGMVVYSVYIYKERRLNLHELSFLFFWAILTLYSIYLGTFNIENIPDPNSFLSRYTLLGKGLWYIFTHHFAWILIISGAIAQEYCFRRQKLPIYQQWVYLIVFLCLIYIVLIPFGGYRPYRPYYIRYDTLMPVTIAMIWLLVYRHIIIQKFNTNKWYSIYAALFITTFLIFQLVGKENMTNALESKTLISIAQTTSPDIQISRDSELLSWDKVDPSRAEDYTKTLQLLNIISQDQKIEIY